MVPLGPRSLLLDLTPLDTPSRLRGPGRYLRELALGLARVPASSLGGLRIYALTHLKTTGEHRITEDLAAFEGSPELPAPGRHDHYRWAYARRLGFARAVRQLGAAAFHLGDPNATPLFGWTSGAKKIVTCHDMIPFLFPERYFGWKDGGPVVGRAIEGRRYRSADAVLAISEATRRDVIRLLGVRSERVVRVYNSVDVERWASDPTAPPAAVLAKHRLTARPYVLAVGAADWHKNPEGTIAGLAAARRAGASVELAWAGKLSRPVVDRISRLAEEAGVRDYVRFLGFVEDDDLAVLFRCAVAHVLLSRSEGFGLTIPESMAAGCPVITTRGGSLIEVAGDAALALEPDDYAGIGSAIARLVAEPRLRADLVAKGRARAPLFSRSVQAEAMLRCYQNVVSNRPVA